MRTEAPEHGNDATALLQWLLFECADLQARYVYKTDFLTRPSLRTPSTKCMGATCGRSPRTRLTNTRGFLESRHSHRREARCTLLKSAVPVSSATTSNLDKRLTRKLLLLTASLRSTSIRAVTASQLKEFCNRVAAVTALRILPLPCWSYT